MATSAAPAFDYVSAIKSLYDMYGANKGVDSATASRDQSGANWNDQMNKGDAAQAGLSNLIGSLSGVTSGTLPSKTTPFASVLNNDALTSFKNFAAEDRGNMLESYGNASEAAGMRVGINEYNTDNVLNRANQKYSSMVGGVDRAATLASSQGFAKALNGGMADSTASATSLNNISRDFADLYAKLREESDSSAQAENDARYKSYLSGKTLEVDQNSKVAQALNQVYSTASQKAASAEGNYLNADNAAQDRLQNALKNQDASYIADKGQNSTLLANLYSTYGSTQSGMIDQALKRYSADAKSADAAVAANGSAQATALEVAMSNPVIKSLVTKVGDSAVKAVTDLIDRGITEVGDIIANLSSDSAIDEDFNATTDFGNNMNYDWNDASSDSLSGDPETEWEVW